MDRRHDCKADDHANSNRNARIPNASMHARLHPRMTSVYPPRIRQAKFEISPAGRINRFRGFDELHPHPRRSSPAERRRRKIAAMAAPAFTMNRAEVVDRNFVAFCKQQATRDDLAPRKPLDQPARDDLPQITGRVLRELFESQIVSRRLDLIARELRKEQRGYYTIGSSGHEGNVVLGRFLRFSDPAFLHYRSGALLAERFRQRPAEADFVRETLLSFMASRLDPIAGGRHKVWGSVPLCVIPQTSTIASQLPRAMGAALALERARRLKIPPVVGAHGEIPPDSIIVCNFGDASANHSVACGALNTSCYAAYQNVPVPLLWVCEDNGIGISVHTASGWIESNFKQRAGLRYFSCDGLDLIDACRGAIEAAEYVRHARRPAFLHMRTVRLLGHAGTDPETEYHTLAQIEANEARDPLLASARIMLDNGWMSADEILALYEDTRTRVRRMADEMGTPPQLTTAEEVIAPLAPYSPAAVRREVARRLPDAQRLWAFELDSTPGFSKLGDRPRLPEHQPARHLAQLLNWALRDLLLKYPESLVFGEDVAARGGVYYVTAGLAARFGIGRVFNTLLDETSILGMAIGAGHLGLLPMPEIQYLAYVHNAIDQLRGEACSTQYFSNGQFRNPMVVRIQSLGYQKGFGGHFHNDNSFAALRDIPGLVIAAPCRGDDAARMLRTCVALAKVDGRVVCFLEPIALYMTKDLYETGDGRWLCGYPAPDDAIALGEGRIYHVGDDGLCRDEPADGEEDLTILTFGNGVHMSLRAARTLRTKHDVATRIVDLRWISPLNEAFVVEQALATGRVLIVDEGRRSGGLSEAIMTALVEHTGGTLAGELPTSTAAAALSPRGEPALSPRGEPAMSPRGEPLQIARVVGHDTYIPLGPAANTVMPTEESVVAAAVALVRGRASSIAAS